jgi:hypothetical protein
MSMIVKVLGTLIGIISILVRFRRSQAAHPSISRSADESRQRPTIRNRDEIRGIVAKHDRRLARPDGRSRDPDARQQVDGGMPVIGRQMTTTGVSDEDLDLLAARGGELTILSPGPIRTMALIYRGRREGAMVVEGWIPSNPRRKSSVRAGLLAQGWRTNANKWSIGRSWTIGDSADRTTLRRDVDAALGVLEGHGLVTSSELRVRHLPAGETDDPGWVMVGCFVSIIASFVGSVGGMLALLLVTSAVDSLGVLIVGFAVAFVVGYIVGFFGAWPVISVASRVELLRIRTEYVREAWVVLASGLAAAAAPWLLALAFGRL